MFLEKMVFSPGRVGNLPKTSKEFTQWKGETATQMFL